MTYEERKEAIKEIKKTKNLEYRSSVRKYTIKEIICGVLVGGGLLTYLNMKQGTIDYGNLGAMPINGWFEEAAHYVSEQIVPKLRNLPELWNAIKGSDFIEHFTAAATSLIAATGIWQAVKKHKLKQQRDKEKFEEIKGLGR